MLITLDTNIYRQLGLNFTEHIDYTILNEYCYSSASEIVLIDIVLKEYLNYYEQEIILKYTQAIENAYSKLLHLERFKLFEKPNFEVQTEGQIHLLQRKLLGELRLRKESYNAQINATELVEFLLHNKRESKGDNTRDYLIWINVISLAMMSRDSKMILISDDKIFSVNEYFKKIKERYKVDNIEIYNSISAFLSVYGFRSEKLTKEFILEGIPIELVRQELLNDMDSIPSYISNYYSDYRKQFKVEALEIFSIVVDEFYAHRDTATNEVKIIAHIQVPVNIVFEPEADINSLIEYIIDLELKTSHKPETFDSEGRPIYKETILFLFSLSYSEAENKLTKVEVIDFFLDTIYYDSHNSSPRRLKLKPTAKLP